MGKDEQGTENMEMNYEIPKGEDPSYYSSLTKAPQCGEMYETVGSSS